MTREKFEEAAFAWFFVLFVCPLIAMAAAGILGGIGWLFLHGFH